MDTAIHFVCSGTCEGVSEEMKTCGAPECSQHGVPLTPCDCTDDSHNSAQEM